MKKNKKITIVLLSVAVLAVPLLGYYFGILLPRQEKRNISILKQDVGVQGDNFQLRSGYVRHQELLPIVDPAPSAPVTTTEQANVSSQRTESKGTNITLYGTLKQFAGSGSMKFYYYDIKSGKVLNDKNKPWFWAVPDLADKVKLDNFIKYVGDNSGAVFKITGKKGKDDCGYIDGVCLEDIIVDEIVLK